MFTGTLVVILVTGTLVVILVYTDLVVILVNGDFSCNFSLQGKSNGRLEYERGYQLYFLANIFYSNPQTSMLALPGPTWKDGHQLVQSLGA